MIRSKDSFVQKNNCILDNRKSNSLLEPTARYTVAGGETPGTCPSNFQDPNGAICPYLFL